MVGLAEAELFPANGILMPLIDSIKKGRCLFFTLLQACRWLSYLIIDILSLKKKKGNKSLSTHLR